MGDDATPSGEVYQEAGKYDKCKWERAWGELNAALHADKDANNLIERLSEGTEEEKREYIEEMIELFNDIAETHNVETFEECWDGNVEECDDHEVSPNGDIDDAE